MENGGQTKREVDSSLEKRRAQGFKQEKQSKRTERKTKEKTASEPDAWKCFVAGEMTFCAISWIVN